MKRLEMRKIFVLLSLLFVIIAGIDYYYNFIYYDSSSYLFEHSTDVYARTVLNEVKRAEAVRYNWKSLELSKIRSEFYLLISVACMVSAFIWPNKKSMLTDIKQEQTHIF